VELTQHDESSIRTILDDYIRLWMEGQSQACADLYDVDGDTLGVDGTFLRGRNAIKQYYDSVMSGKYSGLAVRKLETTALRSLGPGLALLDGTWEVHNATEDDPGTPVMASLVVTHTDDGWRIAACRLMVPAQVGG
jgi:uncharacterized protein (TIGR02246 family)